MQESSENKAALDSLEIYIILCAHLLIKVCLALQTRHYIWGHAAAMRLVYWNFRKRVSSIKLGGL